MQVARQQQQGRRWVLSALALSGALAGCVPATVGTQAATEAEQGGRPGRQEDEAWGTRLRPLYWVAEDGTRVAAPWWFWANPAGPYLPPYARDAYGPLRAAGAAAPAAWRPLLDSALGEPCLFYDTADGATRCLPGWAQLEPEDPLDGYYSEPTCGDFRSWLYVLPTAETSGRLAQRHLVTTRQRAGERPRVRVAVPHAGRAWLRVLSPDGSERLCIEVRSGDNGVSLFDAGPEVGLSEFVKLGGLAADAGPG